jgi:hypothetical protein
MVLYHPNLYIHFLVDATMVVFDWIWYDLLCETAQMAGKLRPESTKVHVLVTAL